MFDHNEDFTKKFLIGGRYTKKSLLFWTARTGSVGPCLTFFIFYFYNLRGVMFHHFLVQVLYYRFLYSRQRNIIDADSKTSREKRVRFGMWSGSSRICAMRCKSRKGPQNIFRLRIGFGLLGRKGKRIGVRVMAVWDTQRVGFCWDLIQKWATDLLQIGRTEKTVINELDEKEMVSDMQALLLSS